MKSSIRILLIFGAELQHTPMVFENSNMNLGGKLILTVNEPCIDWEQSNQDHLIHIIWNHSNADVEIDIDGISIVLPPQCLITTTYYHHVFVPGNQERLIVFSFNRAYYCVYDHDHEVSCNGIIFFGAQKLVVIKLDASFKRKLELLLQVFIDEFEYEDNVQGEMLLMLLKRLIIICTRLAKAAGGLDDLILENVEIIRQFNFLVDMHYKEKKSVKEYADLLFKSPKTLANIFAKSGSKTPLQIIHERIILEARRLLTYTDKNINEIAYELGYKDTATFSKLFKKRMLETPQSFREKR
ncbi:MAG: AraC family transcriptional regulator [Cytophagales bacterium]|nr:AraC family transcriptional regulator [Cytophagales bacterium]